MGGEKRLSTHQHQHQHRHSDQIFENIVRVLSFVVFYYAEGRWFSFPLVFSGFSYSFPIVSFP